MQLVMDDSTDNLKCPSFKKSKTNTIKKVVTTICVIAFRSVDNRIQLIQGNWYKNSTCLVLIQQKGSKQVTSSFIQMENSAKPIKYSLSDYLNINVLMDYCIPDLLKDCIS